MLALIQVLFSLQYVGKMSTLAMVANYTGAGHVWVSCLFFKKYLFTWLRHILVAAHGVFNLCFGMWTLSCNMWDLVLWPGIEPGPPCIRSLSHWTTREVPPAAYFWFWTCRVMKNWCFWTVVLEKTLESPLDSKEIQPVLPKGDQSWIFIGRTDAEDETPTVWPPDAKNWLWCWERLKVGEGDNKE